MEIMYSSTSHDIKLNNYSEMIDNYTDELLGLLSKDIGKKVTTHDIRIIKVINSNKEYRARFNLTNNPDFFGILEYIVGSNILNCTVYKNGNKKEEDDEREGYNKKISSDERSIIFKDKDEFEEYILKNNPLKEEVLKNKKSFFDTTYNNGYKKIVLIYNDETRHEYTYDKTKNKLTHEVFKK